MKNSKKLSKEERQELEILLGKGYAFRAISRVLGRSPNTISYEVRTNGGREGYRARNAHQYARTRRKDARYQWKKIEHHPLLRAYVVLGLLLHWNPDEIAGSMRERKLPFYASKTAIYDWLRSVHGQTYCPYLYSQRWHRKKRKPKTPRVMIPGRISWTERPAGAETRSRYGHWEEDTVVSGRSGTGALAVMAERKSRLILARAIPSLSPRIHAEAVSRMVSGAKTRSITFDNGIENREHGSLGIPTFFCDAYSSWQKGTVENANKMIRRYLPKGTDLGNVPQGELDQIVSVINRKPRKILGYRSALQVATRAGVLSRETKNTATPVS